MARRSLVIGSRGLLGGALVGQMRAVGEHADTVAVTWADEETAARQLRGALETLVAGSAGGDAAAPEDIDDLAIWWCAGAGVTATPQHVLDAELRTLERFVADVAEIVGPLSDRRRSFFYSSSAGGVFAGSDAPPFTELTPTAPLAPYGHAKLRAEAIVGGLVTSGIAVAVGRLANIYGPGQNLAKPQGLISQLCVAHHTARPINVYVSLDTLRDYIYVDDAARLCLDLGDAVRASGAPQPVVKIVGSGRPASIGALIADMRRLFKRRVPVVLAASPFARQQARDLRLRSVVLPELDHRTLTTLINGIDRVNEDVGAQFRAGALHGR